MSLNPYKGKTTGTEKHLTLTEDVLESEFANIAEQRYSLLGKFKDGKIDEAKFMDEDRELRLKGRKMLTQHQLSKGQETFDHLVVSGFFLDRHKNAVQAYNEVFGPFHKMMKEADASEAAGIPQSGEQRITGKTLMKVWNAAGDQVMSDAQSEENYTSLQVFYVEQPVSFLEVVPKTTIDQMDIREFREDDSKVEGDIASRAEAAALTQVDFGTKAVNRDLKSVGSHVKYTLELANDSNRRHFMPYMNARLLEKHRLAVEAHAIAPLGTAAANTSGKTYEARVGAGNGKGQNPTGILAETGIIDPGAQTNKTWDFAYINLINTTAIIPVLKNAYRPPSHILMNPQDYYEMLTIGTTSEGWFLSAPVSVNAPLGATIPTLFGIPVIIGWTLPKGTVVVANLMHTLLYTNGAIVQRDQGLDGNDLTKLERTIIMYCWMQQFSRFPNWICRFRVAQ